MSPEGSKPSREQIAASIPGVRLGAGVPIEAATEARAARIRIESREARSDLIVIDIAKYGDYLKAKLLTSDELIKTGWIPRYNEITGEVYTTRWDTPPVTIDGGKQRLVTDPKMQYQVLRKPGRVRKVDLNAIPMAWTIGRLIPQKLLTIEDALKQQDEISHDYFVDGPEFARVEEVSSEIRALSVDFIQKHPRLEEDYQDLRDRVAEVFIHHGLEYAASPIWRRVEDKIRRAVQRDKLGRNNPSASRFILASAILNTVTREVVTGLTREKSRNIYTHLEREREVERDYLTWASDKLIRVWTEVEKSVGMDPKRLTDDRITSFRNSLKMVDIILSRVRVSPYLQVASLAREYIASETFRKRFENEKITARLDSYNLGMIFENFEGVSAEEYIMRRNVKGALRMLKGSNSLINACLSDPQNFDIDVFGHDS